MVQGSAGQFLHVKVKFGSGDPMNSVSAYRPGGSQKLDALREGGDASGNYVYRLPETAAYPVEFDPAGRSGSIEFSLLPGDDPMLTPGIAPEQISIDFGSFGQQREMKLEPFGQWEGYMDDWQPTNWALENKGLEFRIMQVAGYKKVFSGPDMRSDVAVMENLEAALKPGAKIRPDIALPYPVYGDAGLDYSTRSQLLVGEGWRGLRRIEVHSQDTGCPPGHLAYVFEGISDDGRFFILMRRWIANPQLESRLNKDCAAGLKAAGASSDSFFKAGMPAILDRDVTGTDPASFQPSLDQLDAVIVSLKLRPQK
jgi:hypothetical protein